MDRVCKTNEAASPVEGGALPPRSCRQRITSRLCTVSVAQPWRAILLRVNGRKRDAKILDVEARSAPDDEAPQATARSA